jgi:hypothetical protein
MLDLMATDLSESVAEVLEPNETSPPARSCGLFLLIVGARRGAAKLPFPECSVVASSVLSESSVCARRRRNSPLRLAAQLFVEAARFSSARHVCVYALDSYLCVLGLR